MVNTRLFKSFMVLRGYNIRTLSEKSKLSYNTLLKK